MGNPAPSPRLTYQGLRVLQEFLQNPTQELCGADLIKALGLPSGTLYPILLRFERYELLESRWEETDPSTLNKPRRRLYRITPNGYETASRALRKLAVPQLSPVPIKV
jgi:PadR family transcriptional regulator, regulatory protein PadR